MTVLLEFVPVSVFVLNVDLVVVVKPLFEKVHSMTDEQFASSVVTLQADPASALLEPPSEALISMSFEVSGHFWASPAVRVVFTVYVPGAISQAFAPPEDDDDEELVEPPEDDELVEPLLEPPEDEPEDDDEVVLSSEHAMTRPHMATIEPAAIPK